MDSIDSEDRGVGTTSEVDDRSEAEREAIRERRLAELERRLAGNAVTEPVYIEDRGQLSTLVSEHHVVLVDFYADWCGPCKVLDPIVRELATESPAVVAKVDVDSQPSLAREANVRGVPTLMLYVDGDPVERLTGARDRQTLDELIERYA